MVSRVLPGQQSYQRKEKVIKLVLSNPQMKIQHRSKNQINVLTRVRKHKRCAIFSKQL